MGCGCGNSKVEYEVRFADGRTQRFATTAEALAAMRGQTGASYKAVAKT